MLDETRILGCAKKAAYVAYKVLGLDCRYSVVLINDPSIKEDGRLDTQKNEIQVNLARLEPFSQDIMPTHGIMTDEDRTIDEDYRHMMKICYVVFHEMRHLYQKRAVDIYIVNGKLGGHSVKLLESDKKCALWLDEMKAPAEGQDIEEDAEDFAYYLSNRYPIQLQMLETSRRIGVFKRKYDKVKIPEADKADI